MDVITFPENLLTTSGLSILLHGVISLSGATSYDKIVLASVNSIMHESRGGERESGPPPPGKSQYIGFFSNIGPDSLENHKATKPASIVGLSSAR